MRSVANNWNEVSGFMYTLEGVSSVANFITAYEESQITETPIFLSVVCSLLPKTIILRLFYYTSAGVSAVWRR